MTHWTVDKMTHWTHWFTDSLDSLIYWLTGLTVLLTHWFTVSLDSPIYWFNWLTLLTYCTGITLLTALDLLYSLHWTYYTHYTGLTLLTTLHWTHCTGRLALTDSLDSFEPPEDRQSVYYLNIIMFLFLIFKTLFFYTYIIRWLLLEMKREFPFEMALKAMEVTWSSLPPATADTRVSLWEMRFSPKISPSTKDLSKPCDTPYGNVSVRLKKLNQKTSSTVDLVFKSI